MVTLDVILYLDDTESDDLPTRDVRVIDVDVDFDDLVEGDEDAWETVTELALTEAGDLGPEWVVSHAINVLTNQAAYASDEY